MQFGTDWTTLKNFAVARNLSVQYIATPDTYYLWAIDGSAEVYSQIAFISPTPSGSDQADFETNFKTNGNQSLKTAVIQHLGADTLTLCPFGVSFTAAANQVTTFSYTLTAATYLKGGVLYVTPGTMGDQLTVQIVDVNNVLGYGANFVVATYVNGWYVIPSLQNTIEDISVSALIPAGLCVNFLYANVSTTQATQVVVNLLSYTGTV